MGAPLRVGGGEGLAGLAVEVPWSVRLGARIMSGAMVGAQGLTLRDTTATLSWLVVDRDPVQVRVRPGLTLPTGGSGTRLALMPGATGSVDPYLSASAATGGLWVASLSLEGRLPLVAGLDGVRQGAFGRADLLGGRRLGGAAIVHGGLSSIGIGGAGGELALSGGGIWNVSARWALTAQLRLPVWSPGGASPYPLAGGIGVRGIVGQ